MRTAACVGLCLVLVLLGGGRAPGQLDKKDKEKADKELAVVVSNKSIGQWIKLLEDKDVLPRIQAINALRQAGPEARRAAPALIGVFRDKEATFLHPLAALALARIGADAVPELEKALKNDSHLVRGGAALALGLIGPAARPAVPGLAVALKDSEPLVRTTAAEALGRIGSLARAGVPALRTALTDSNSTVAVEAAAALWKVASETRGVDVLVAALQKDSGLAETAASVLGDIGPGAKAAVPQLKTTLRAKSVRLRIAAAEALYRVNKDAGSALPVLQDSIEAKEAGDRLQTVAALGTLGAEEKAASLLVGLLKHADAATRREAACSLAERGVVLENALPALEAGLQDHDPGVRWWCALALAGADIDIRKKEEDVIRIFRTARMRHGDRELGKVIQEVQGPASVRAASALASALRTKSARLRTEAAKTLGRLGADTRQAQAALIDTLKSDDKSLRRAAAEALGQIGPEAQPALIRLLGNYDDRVREGGARALGRMGILARSAVEGLMRLLKDPDSAVRTQVALALWRIDGKLEDPLRMLKLVLLDVDNKDRWEAVEAVGVISVEARPAVKGLIELVVTALKDRDARVRTEAVRWMFRRERKATVALPLLRDGVTDRDVFVRMSAVEILGELGGEARVVPLLTTALEDRDAGVRLAAEEALARGGAESVPQLIEALKSKSAKVRLGVVRALGLMGAPAKAAVPALDGLKGDKDPAVRQAVEETLREIGPVKAG